jgi:beta-lactamase class A
MIARGEAVDAGASQEMVNLLASEEIDNGLRAGVPEGTLVAHKTGNWSNATHDAGIVYSPAATYVIAVLSEKAYETELTAEVSRVAWEYYNGAIGGEEGQ